MVDTGRVRALLDRLGDEVGHLRRAAERPREELARDDDMLAAIKYRFIVAIEICIDVAEHIIASEGLRAPETFADAFRSLTESGMLPTDQAEALQAMAGFRNLLVHGYTPVDDERVVEILQTKLADFDHFRTAVARALT